MAEPMKVTVVSDYICPWCYIASRRVAQFEREFEVRVEWWPFELHPETPPEGRHVDEVLSRKGLGEEYRQNLREQAAAAGVAVSNRWLANSHRALELAEFARDRGAFATAHEALFEAYFVEGRNIGEMAVLLQIAQACGLDPDEFGFECLVGRYAELIEKTTGLARSKGFSSTPTIIFGDRMLVPGAQDYAVYEDVLTRLGATRRTPEA
jgi:predicted DsbA family dithiol-disulfide isomerase